MARMCRLIQRSCSGGLSEGLEGKERGGVAIEGDPGFCNLTRGIV